MDPMRVAAAAALVACACAPTLQERIAKDLQCSWHEDGIDVEESDTELAAWGCGRKATYRVVMLSSAVVEKRYAAELVSVVPDSRPVAKPRKPLESLDVIPCASNTDCAGTDVCEDKRCVRHR